MKRGPSKRTMERWLAPTAAPLLTDWIPCTTPPVREGEYEVEHIGGPTGPKEWRAMYLCGMHGHGRWVRSDDGVVIDALMEHPDKFRWRGVRRWVLTVRDFLNGERTYVANVSTRGVLYLTDKLHAPWGSRPYSAAISFATEAKAVAYATKHARRLSGWKAVLP
jgi:hypothetical protein